MKGRLKTRLISSLLIIFILTNTFSPYSVLLNKSYAADSTSGVQVDTLSVKPAVVFKRTTGIETASNGQRYFGVELGVLGDSNAADGAWVISKGQVYFRYATDKIAPLSKSNAVLDSNQEVYLNGGRDKFKISNYVSEISGGLTLEFGLEQAAGTRLNYSGNTEEGPGAVSFELSNNDRADPVWWFGEHPDSTFNGKPYMPVATMNFAIIDDTITDVSQLTFDLNANNGILSLNRVKAVNSGILLVYYDDYDTAILGDTTTTKEITSEYLTVDGFTLPGETKEISKVELIQAPTKDEYEHGDTVDLTDGKIKITYSNNDIEEVELKDNTDFVLDKQKVNVGQTEIKGTYLGKYEIKYSITVTDPIASIERIGELEKAEYNQGNTIELEGISVVVKTKSEKENNAPGRTIKLPSTEVTVSEELADVDSVNAVKSANKTPEGFDIATQTIYLTYGGKSVGVDILVNDTIKEITNISGYKTTYEYMDEFDYNQGEITVKTTSGATFTKRLTLTTVNGFDGTNLNRQTLTVSYLGKKSPEFYVTVTDPILDIGVRNFKTTYNPEEELDFTGAKVYGIGKSTATYSEVDLTSGMVSNNYVSTKVGEQILTISYLGKTKLVKVTVLNPITDIEVTEMKTEYNYGDSLSITGAKVRPVFYDKTTGEWVNVTQEMITKTFNPNQVGPQTVTVQYEGISKDIPVTVKDTVREIVLKTSPKTRYKYGTGLDVENGEITVKWNSGKADSTEAITSSMITEADGGPFTSNVTFPEGQTTLTKPLTITYGGETTTYDVTIVNEVTGIAMKTTPKTTQYNVNDKLDVTGGEITITRANQATEDKEIDESWVKGFDSKTNATNQVLTVTYEEDGADLEEDGTPKKVGGSTTYKVDIVDQVKSIEVISQPTKKEYGYDEAINLDGAQIKVTYGSGETTIPVTGDMVNYSPTTIGRQELTVTYGGKSDTEHTIVVEVINKLVGIEMGTMPQTKYAIREDINKNGTIKIIRQYNDEENPEYKDLTASGVTVTGFNSSAEAKNQRLTVTYSETYKESSASAETHYNVDIIDELISIQLIDDSNEEDPSKKLKKEYRHGEELSKANGKVILNLKSGDTIEKELSECVVEGYIKEPTYDSDNTSTQTITVSYTKDGVTKSCNYEVTVKNYIDRIEVTAPTKIDYGYGEALNLAGGKVTKIMANGARIELELDDPTVTIENKDTVTNGIGRVKVNVTCEGKPGEFYITIQDQVTSIILYENEDEDIVVKRKYNIGDSFSTGGAYILVKSNSNPSGSIIQINRNMVTGFSSDTITANEPNGTRTLTITTENGLTVYGETEPWKIEIPYVVNDYVTGIELTVPEGVRKYKYTTNEDAKLNITGIEVRKKMASGDETQPFDLKAGGVKYGTDIDNNVEYVPNKTGEQTVYVRYKEGDQTWEASFTIYVRDELESISLTTDPKRTYIYGEPFLANGAQIKIKKASGYSTIDLTEEYITNFYTEASETITASQALTNGTPREATVSYTWGDIGEEPKTATTTFLYNVNDQVKDFILTEPTNKLYYYGQTEELNLDGGKVQKVMKSGITQSEIDLEVIRNMVTGYNPRPTTLGEQEITVTYEGITKTFTIEVKDKLLGISLKNLPEQTYFVGDEPKLTGAKLVIDRLKVDEEVDLTKEMIDDFTTATPTANGETRTATVPLTEDGITVTPATFTYTVRDYVREISKTQPPTNTKYYLNDENLSLEGGYIEVANATGGEPERIDLSNDKVTVKVDEFDTTTPGKKTITVEYVNEKNEKLTTSFEVTVWDRIESITMEGTPKSAYKFGEDIQLNGAKLVVNKLSGTEKVTITEAMLNNTLTTNSLTEEGTSRTATATYTSTNQYLEIPEGKDKVNFNYTVEDYIKSVTLKAPSKVKYDYGTDLDLSDGYLIITMASENPADNIPLDNDEVTITGYNKNQLGSQTVNITYKEFTEGLNFGVVVENKVKEVQFNIDSINAKDYKHGENLDLSEATAKLIMLDGTERTVKIDNSMISGYTSTELGEQEITITVEGKQEKITVNVVDYVKSVELTPPEKNVYTVKEQLDLSDGKLKVTMASGKVIDNIPLTDSKVKVTGYTPTKLGSQVVKVVYDNNDNLAKEFPVQVVDKLADISIESMPNKTQIKYGEELSLEGAKIRVTNESGDDKVLDITPEMIKTKFNPEKLGPQTIKVEYTEDGVTKSTEFTVVVEDYVKQIKFTKPNKTSYKYGEELDPTGAKFTEILASGAIKQEIEITKDMIEGFNSKVVGNQTLTVSYGDKKEKFEVSVVDNVHSVAITKLPDKTEYNKGESINLVGGTITIVKDSGIYNLDITEDMVTGYDSNKPGSQVLTITYGNQQAFLSVTVKDNGTGDNGNGDNGENTQKPNKPNKPNKPSNGTNSGSSDSNGTVVDDVTGGIIDNNTSDDKTNANDSQNKDKEHNNDVDKDITLAEKAENSDDDKQKRGNIIVKTATVSGLGLVALIALVFIIKRKTNVRIYEEDENELILVGKEKIDEDYREIDISKYVENAPDKNIVVVLNKNITKKLDKQKISIKIDKEELETIVEYEDGEFEIRIEK